MLLWHQDQGHYLALWHFHIIYDKIILTLVTVSVGFKESLNVTERKKIGTLYSTQFWQWWACSSRTAVWFLRFMQRAAFAWTQPFFFFFFLFQCRLASHFLQIATANCHCHSLNNSCRRPCLSIYSCPILLSDYCWWRISVRIACFWQCSVPDIAGLVLSAPILCRY